MHLAKVLLVGFGLTICSLFIFAQTSAPKVQKAADSPHNPSFEYLGRLHAETGTRTVIENAPQGTRTIVQITGGRFEGPKLKATLQTPAGDWITNRADGRHRLHFP